MLYIVFSAIVAPFLTYYISTTLFYQRANSKAPKKRPPIIPFFLPVFHTFSLAYEGPQRYFATLIKQYGSFAPFSFRAGLKTFFVLRDADHVSRVLNALNETTAMASRMELSKKLFGAPQELWLKHARSDLPPKYLTSTSLGPLTDMYLSILSSNLNDKMFQVGSWTQIEDFWSFFQQVVTRCIIETLFGSAILKQYSSIIKDCQKFAETADDFIPGMPSFVVSTGYEAPRERLLQGIEKWLKTNHSGAEFAKIGDEDPVWDEHKGSKFIQERDDMFTKIEGVDLRARASEMLSVIHEATSSILSPTLWTIFEILHRPHIHKHLITEVSKHYSPISQKYNINSIANAPLLRSIQAETRRLRVATALTRTVETQDFQLDAHWKLSKGDNILIFSHDLALNKALWAKARPYTVECPLEEFWAERFLISYRATSSAKRDKIETGKFSLESLEILSGTAFDDGILGKEYVQVIQTATLAVFLTQFDLELCDPDGFAAANPPVRESAYGVVKPMEWITVRIRKCKAEK